MEIEQRSLARAALVRQRLLTHAEGSPCRAFMPLLLALQAHAFQAPYSVVALVLLVSLLTGIAYPDAYRWVRGAGGGGSQDGSGRGPPQGMVPETVGPLLAGAVLSMTDSR